MTTISKVLRRSVVHVALFAVAVFWLVPTLGLFVTSLRPVETYGRSGWWTALTKPAELTMGSYRAFFENPDLVDSVWNTVLITVPSALLVVLIASMAGYAFAWINFPGLNVLFLVVVGLLVVPLQMALIPSAPACARPFRGGPAQRRLGMADLPSHRAPARRSGHRRPRDLPVPLGLERPARGSHLRRRQPSSDRGHRPALGQFGSNIGVIAPAAFISITVPLVVFFAFQRHFEAGLLGGSVK